MPRVPRPPGQDRHHRPSPPKRRAQRRGPAALPAVRIAFPARGGNLRLVPSPHAVLNQAAPDVWSARLRAHEKKPRSGPAPRSRPLDLDCAGEGIHAYHRILRSDAHRGPSDASCQHRTRNFLKNHRNFTGRNRAHYFDIADREIAALLPAHRDAFAVWQSSSPAPCIRIHWPMRITHARALVGQSVTTGRVIGLGSTGGTYTAIGDLARGRQEHAQQASRRERQWRYGTSSGCAVRECGKRPKPWGMSGFIPELPETGLPDPADQPVG